MARKKNIAIDDDVYESLLDIGSKRDTFSDIIRKCINAYRAVQQESRTHIGKVDEHYEESDRQLQPKIIDKIIQLPGIEFPADRSKIIKEAAKSTKPAETNYLRHIENRKYKNESDLQNELNRETTTEEGHKVIFYVTNEKLRKEQESKVIS